MISIVILIAGVTGMSVDAHKDQLAEMDMKMIAKMNALSKFDNPMDATPVERHMRNGMDDEESPTKWAAAAYQLGHGGSGEGQIWYDDIMGLPKDKRKAKFEYFRDRREAKPTSLIETKVDAKAYLEEFHKQFPAQTAPDAGFAKQRLDQEKDYQEQFHPAETRLAMEVDARAQADQKKPAADEKKVAADGKKVAADDKKIAADDKKSSLLSGAEEKAPAVLTDSKLDPSPKTLPVLEIASAGTDGDTPLLVMWFSVTAGLVTVAAVLFFPMNGNRRIRDAVGFMTCSGSLLLCTKFAVYYTQMPLLVIFSQLCFTAMVVLVSCAFGLIDLKPPDMYVAWRFLPIASTFTLVILMSAEILKAANMETMITVRTSTVLVVCALETVFLGSAMPSLRGSTMLGIVVASAMCYGYVESEDFRFQISIWIFVWYSAFCFDQIYIKHVISELKLSIWTNVVYTNILSAFITFPFALNEAHQVRTGAITGSFSGDGIVLVLASCMVGTAMAYFSFAARESFSATTFTLLGGSCKFASILFNNLLWVHHAGKIGNIALIVALTAAYGYDSSPKPESEGKDPWSTRMAREVVRLFGTKDESEEQDSTEAIQAAPVEYITAMVSHVFGANDEAEENGCVQDASVKSEKVARDPWSTIIARHAARLFGTKEESEPETHTAEDPPVIPVEYITAVDCFTGPAPEPIQTEEVAEAVD